MNANLEAFAKEISEIIQYDYGDFMRVANGYLINLTRNLRNLDDEAIRNKLAEMQSYLQFAPNWDVESTRERLLEDVKYLDEIMRGHKQDWESAS